MKFGIHNSSSADTPDPAEAFEAVKAKAQWAEEHGFVRFSVLDHMIQIPRVGGPHEPVLEGWTVLAALAAVTRRIRLATLCTAVGYRNPAHLAKIAASVDLISRGRLTLGIGAGREEEGRLRALRLREQQLHGGRPITRSWAPLLVSGKRIAASSVLSQSRRSPSPSSRRKPVSASRQIAASPVGCSPAVSAACMAFPSFAISAWLKRRSRGVLARRRTPLAGLLSIFPRRTACSKMAWSEDIVRAATPSPPVVAPPRLPARRFAVLPAAISAWAPSMSPRVSEPTWHMPTSGLICASIRLRSIASVEGLIGRRRRPRIRPASASARYQSRSEDTVMALRSGPGEGRGIDPLGDGAQNVPGGLSRLLWRHQAVTPDHGAPVPALGSAILHDEALEARRADTDAEAAQLKIPEELFRTFDPNLGRFQSVDRALADLSVGFQCLERFSLPFADDRLVGSGMEHLRSGRGAKPAPFGDALQNENVVIPEEYLSAAVAGYPGAERW